jgi:hypothetical protein
MRTSSESSLSFFFKSSNHKLHLVSSQTRQELCFFYFKPIVIITSFRRQPSFNLAISPASYFIFLPSEKTKNPPYWNNFLSFEFDLNEISTWVTTSNRNCEQVSHLNLELKEGYTPKDSTHCLKTLDVLPGSHISLNRYTRLYSIP